MRKLNNEMIGRKSILGIFFLVLAYFFNVNTRVKIKGKLVNTKSGVVRGIVSQSRDGRDFYEWLGIPYAQPPVGELRFEVSDENSSIDFFMGINIKFIHVHCLLLLVA